MRPPCVPQIVPRYCCGFERFCCKNGMIVTTLNLNVTIIDPLATDFAQDSLADMLTSQQR